MKFSVYYNMYVSGEIIVDASSEEEARNIVRNFDSDKLFAEADEVDTNFDEVLTDEDGE